MADYRVIDMETYPRIAQFRHFSAMAVPTAAMTVKLDVTNLVRFAKARECSFYMAMTHIAATAANRIPELRRRTRDGGIIEYAVCGTSHIELLPDDSYCYCTLWHDKDWDEFLPYAKERREAAKASRGLAEDGEVDALYFVTCLPWFHYEAVTMPIPDPVPDNPSFCWGKYEENFRGRLMMPFTVSANHALMDGVHFGRFLKELQNELDALG